MKASILNFLRGIAKSAAIKAAFKEITGYTPGANQQELGIQNRKLIEMYNEAMQKVDRSLEIIDEQDDRIDSLLKDMNSLREENTAISLNNLTLRLKSDQLLTLAERYRVITNLIQLFEKECPVDFLPEFRKILNGLDALEIQVAEVKEDLEESGSLKAK